MSGCSFGERSVFVPGSDEQAVLLIALTPNSDAVGWAFVPDHQGRIVADELDTHSDLTLFRLEYQETLAELMLSPGRLPLDPAGARPLEKPHRAQRSSWVDGAQGPWTEVAGLPSELASMRLDLPADSLCLSLGRTDFELPDGGDQSSVRFVVDAGRGRVLAHVNTGDFFLVDRIDGVRNIEPAGLSTTTSYLGATTVASGELWLVAEDSLWRGHVDSGFERVAMIHSAETSSISPGLLSNRVRVAGPSRLDSQEELFVLTREVELYRYFEGMWQFVGRLLDPRTTNWISLAWVAPGEALASSDDHLDYMHYQDGEVRTVRTEFNFESLANLGEAGIFAGSEYGTLRRWTGTEFELVTTLGGTRISAMGKLPGGGLFVGGDSGVFRQFFPSTVEACGDDILHTGTPYQVVPMAEGWVLWPFFRGGRHLSWIEVAE
jgi:hypothetical protein